MLNNILLVCIGNICRSPMAAGVLADKLIKIAPAVKVTSAGIAALVGESANNMAQQLMLHRGIDISSHRARQMTPELLLAADLILVMDLRQQQLIECKVPSVCGRVYRLGKWGGFD